MNSEVDLDYFPGVPLVLENTLARATIATLQGRFDEIGRSVLQATVSDVPERDKAPLCLVP